MSVLKNHHKQLNNNFAKGKGFPLTIVSVGDTYHFWSSCGDRSSHQSHQQLQPPPEHQQQQFLLQLPKTDLNLEQLKTDHFFHLKTDLEQIETDRRYYE